MIRKADAGHADGRCHAVFVKVKVKVKVRVEDVEGCRVQASRIIR